MYVFIQTTITTIVSSLLVYYRRHKFLLIIRGYRRFIVTATFPPTGDCGPWRCPQRFCLWPITRRARTPGPRPMNPLIFVYSPITRQQNRQLQKCLLRHVTRYSDFQKFLEDQAKRHDARENFNGQMPLIAVLPGNALGEKNDACSGFTANNWHVYEQPCVLIAITIEPPRRVCGAFESNGTRETGLAKARHRNVNATFLNTRSVIVVRHNTRQSEKKFFFTATGSIGSMLYAVVVIDQRYVQRFKQYV